MTDRLFYLKELSSNECQCGRHKSPRNSFCFHCYSDLPNHIQKELWQMLGDGYEEAYDAAVHYLNS